VKSWTRIRTALLAAVFIAGVASPAAWSPPASAQGEPFVFCSDIAFPPMEFMQGNEPVGADIDIGTEVAKRLGRTAEFTNTGFDAIIAALQSKHCDAIISGMNDTPERAKQVDFVDYLNVGQSLVVKPGNPLNLTTLESLCGHAAGAQVGTTNLDTLNKVSDECVAAGKEKIDISGFPTDTDGILALKADRIDVYETDSSVAAYYIGQDPEAFQFGGPAIGAIPVGIAVRKDDNALRDQIRKAIDDMYADGTMTTILEKWKLQDFAYPPGGAATPVATPAAG
jgi:polar amino acid transport system substrate-binding protein